MDIFLPQGFTPDKARPRVSAANRHRQLHVDAGGILLAVLRSWSRGFVTASEGTPALTGLVSVFDGSELLYSGVITGSHAVGDERHYAVRRAGRPDLAAREAMDPVQHASR
ncbi:hypothetical protein KDD17_12575 [Sulfitobacter albidus]|uniref:Uncharacterized protein n=1 Tax=Sulfitobacter albidus TaxID=2829501 RepID=A0A975JCF0_9RHOB|nr:hypothetical protein [Sulfitobacter albidus]QUJ75777.1 hypothetical protein KDD17_12575 [Sulfitobacter albidus]